MNRVYLCVAPDGELETWSEAEDGTDEFFEVNRATYPAMAVTTEVGAGEFWGREIIDEWIEPYVDPAVQIRRDAIEECARIYDELTDEEIEKSGSNFAAHLRTLIEGPSG
jgi:hypothetical protein